MSCYITFTNLNHFEKKAFIYLISNIFPELDIMIQNINIKKIVSFIKSVIKK